MPKSISSANKNVLNTDVDNDEDPSKSEYFQCKSIQVLRSVAHWSSGIRSPNNQPETSIYLAYKELITSAKKFIYIENQFFVSSATDDTRECSNYSIFFFKFILRF